MARGLSFSTAVLTVLIALALAHETCSTKPNHHCPPSSCGNIPNISFPFRLESDPERCGDPTYALSCENNLTVLYLFGRRYYVQEISYNNYTIRVVDSGILKDNYFSTPNYSLYRYNFSSQYYPAQYTTYQLQSGPNSELSRGVVLMSCEKPVNSPFYLDTSTCNNSSNISSSHSMRKRYRYVTVGSTTATEVGDSCKVEQMFLTSWPGNEDPNNVSCKDVHNELVYGFELSWLQGYGESYCGKHSDWYLNDTNHDVICTVRTKIGIFDYILPYLSKAWNLIARIIGFRDVPPHLPYGEVYGFRDFPPYLPYGFRDFPRFPLYLPVVSWYLIWYLIAAIIVAASFSGFKEQNPSKSDCAE